MNIIIVDNHLSYREGLKHLLEINLPNCCVEVLSFHETSVIFNHERITDLLIIDPFLDKKKSEKIIDKSLRENTKVVLLTSDICKEIDTMLFLKKSIHGFLFKGSRTSSLISVLISMMKDDVKYIEPAVANILINNYQNSTPSNNLISIY